MSRARYRTDWFELLSDDAHFEIEFERLILQNSDLLRKGAIVVPFKETITARGLPPRRADLALVDEHYRFWWIIEVELVGHSLEGHVIPQVRTFVEGQYNERHATALLKASEKLDGDRLRAMMFGEQPQVVVISNRFITQWKTALTNEGVNLAVMNVYRSDQNRDIFVVEGGLPSPTSDCLTDLVAHRQLGNLFRVRSPGGLPPCPDKKLITFLGSRTVTFTLMEIATDWFLAPDERLGASEYSIYSDTDGKLILRGK